MAFAVTGWVHGITVTVLRSGGGDAQGDQLPGSEHPIGPCVVQPRGDRGQSAESDVRGQQVTEGLTLLVPVEADVVATDRVRIEDPLYAGTYDVLGRPVPLRSPFSGWTPGKNDALQAVEG